MFKNYYIYQYFDPIRNEPIYIGAGHGNRINFHLKRKDNHPLPNRIKWIRKQGLEPIVTKLHENLDYFDAFTIEPFIIKEIGRKKLGEGSLLNLTNGGEGSYGYKPSRKTLLKLKQNSSGKNNGMYGKHHSEETKEKIRKGNLNPPSERIEKNRLAHLGKKQSIETINKKIQKISKNWLIFFPDGQTKSISNLNKFCKENKLNHGCMYSVSRGIYSQHHGFKCMEVI